MKTQNIITNIARREKSMLIILFAVLSFFLNTHVSRACYGLKINSPSNGTSIRITGTLNLNYSNITTDNTYFVIMDTNATVGTVSNSSYIAGPVAKNVKSGSSTFDFPVGKDGGNGTAIDGLYRPIGIKDPNGAGTFKAEYIHKYPSQDGFGTGSANIVGGGTGFINHVGKNEYWQLTRTVGTQGAKIRISWDGYTGGVNDINNIVVTHWNTGLGKWELTGSTGAATLEAGSTNAKGMVTTNEVQTTFSPFGVASKNANNPLPIELLTFEGELVKDQIKLSWTTASEINNDFFTIEKSKDGVNYFTAVGQTKGAGTSTEPHNYSLNDPRPYKGTNYYRLKQTDYDKTNTYSDVIAVDYMPKTWGNVSVYPNPANDRIMIEAVVTEDKDVTIEITDVLGKTVKESKHSLNEGKNTVKIDLSEQANGIYMIYIKDKTTNEVITIQKFTKGQ